MSGIPSLPFTLYQLSHVPVFDFYNIYMQILSNEISEKMFGQLLNKEVHCRALTVSITLCSANTAIIHVVQNFAHRNFQLV